MPTLINALAAYLYAALLALTGLPPDCDRQNARRCHQWEQARYERPDAARARLAITSNQLAVERDKRDGDPYEALELVALGIVETGFLKFVVDGTCNKRPLPPELRARILRAGGCDNGRAWTAWQFHPDTLRDVQLGITGPDFVADQALAIHVAWSLLQVRPRAWTTWGRARRLARWWWANHPYAAGSAS